MRSVAIALFFTVLLAAADERATISGTVINSQTGLPIAGARIQTYSARGSVFHVLTPATGAYRAILQPGKYKLRITAPAYQGQQFSNVCLDAKTPFRHVFRLRPLSDMWETSFSRTVVGQGGAVLSLYGPDIDMAGLLMSTDSPAKSCAIAEDTNSVLAPLMKLPFETRRTGRPAADEAAPPTRVANSQPQTRNAVTRFRQALESGDLVPGAYEAFQALRATAPDTEPGLEAELLTALEDAARRILRTYMQGEEKPQSAADFAIAAEWIKTAQSVRFKARLEPLSAFFKGRALIFEKRYQEAVASLEGGLGYDKQAAYIYNALGTAYLEQARIDLAECALREAVRCAPAWAYPRHNLALAYLQSGDYDNSVSAYVEAIRLKPSYMSLWYNLGSVLQSTGRDSEAARTYGRAAQIAPEESLPYVALGVLQLRHGRLAEAEQLLIRAVSNSPQNVTARHDLAIAYSRTPESIGRAIALWQDNIREHPDFLSSRLALAETFVRIGRLPEAVAQYQVVMLQRPDYLAGRLQLADLYLHMNQPEEAATLLEAYLRNSFSASVAVFERLGDARAALHDMPAAAAAYSNGLEKTVDQGERARIKKKLGSLDPMRSQSGSAVRLE